MSFRCGGGMGLFAKTIFSAILRALQRAVSDPQHYGQHLTRPSPPVASSFTSDTNHQTPLYQNHRPNPEIYAASLTKVPIWRVNLVPLGLLLLPIRRGKGPFRARTVCQNETAVSR